MFPKTLVVYKYSFWCFRPMEIELLSHSSVLTWNSLILDLSFAKNVLGLQLISLSVFSLEGESTDNIFKACTKLCL